jgi:hypothetical protein
MSNPDCANERAVRDKQAAGVRNRTSRILSFGRIVNPSIALVGLRIQTTRSTFSVNNFVGRTK